MKVCNIYNVGGFVYIIPNELVNSFEETTYEDKEDRFSEYILQDDMIIEEIEISPGDFRNFLENRD